MNNVFKGQFEKYIEFAISNIENKLISSYISNKQYECWLNSFLQTGSTSRILKQTQLKKIAKSTTMLRYFYITVENSRKQFPIDDFIIAFRMELYDAEVDYRIEDIIETAISILKKWKAYILKNKLLFAKVTLFDNITFSSGDFGEEYKKSLTDRNLFTQNYFKSYEDRWALNTVRVHFNLPTRRWLNWKEPYVDIKVNLSDMVELGFIRCGYDYQLLDVRREDAFLKYALLSKEMNREVLKLNEDGLRNYDNIIWLR